MRLVRVTAFCKRFVDNARKRVSQSRGAQSSENVSCASQKGAQLSKDGSCVPPKEAVVRVLTEKLPPRNKLVIRKMVPKLAHVLPPLSPEEISWAENHVLAACQAEAFPQEVQRLKTTGEVAAQSQLRCLRPCMDENDLIRVNGRLRNSQHLDKDAKNPVVLPKNHHITRLIIWHHHANLLKHTAGTAHTLSELNQKYYIIRGPSQVRRVLAGCTLCRRKNAKVKHQEMAPLPEHRYAPEGKRVWPFYHTGIDAAGPYEVNLGRGTRKTQALHKRWIIIFTCSVYRCVHFELVSSLSTDAFLESFSRFLARRPRPRFINSDNGGNFEGGKSIVQELLNNLKTREVEITKEYADISWTLNTPLSPHQGGHYERLIGSMKKSLAVTLPSAGPLKEEELNTCLITCEGLLNSRPISYVSSDPDDLLPLTPAHFLMQTGYRDLAPVVNFRPTRLELCERWLHIQHAMDRLWSRFIREVVPQMNKMNKWTTKRREIQAGDVVVLLENKTRGIWPIGRVLQTYKNSQDGHVRRAKIFSSGREYDRSLSRIMVIQESPPPM